MQVEMKSYFERVLMVYFCLVFSPQMTEGRLSQVLLLDGRKLELLVQVAYLVLILSQRNIF